MELKGHKRCAEGTCQDIVLYFCSPLQNFQQSIYKPSVLFFRVLHQKEHFFFLSMNILDHELCLNSALCKEQSRTRLLNCVKFLLFFFNSLRYYANVLIINLIQWIFRSWSTSARETKQIATHILLAEKSGFMSEFVLATDSSKLSTFLLLVTTLYFNIPCDKVTTKPVMFFTSEHKGLTSSCTFSINSNGSGGLLSTSIKEMREREQWDFTILAFKD